MARIFVPTKEQEDGYRGWVCEQPEPVRTLGGRFDPWSLYRMKSTGQRVTIVSFSEDGTVTVDVSGAHNAVMFERQVFGIKADDLEPCDMPDPSEVLGSALTWQQVEENIDAFRVLLAPDLWVMGEDGIAHRRDN